MRVLTGSTQTTRVSRRPNFPIAGTMNPFGLYPLWAHPVLPGETLDRLSAKYRVLSKPIKHPLAGAWLETWVCYVKLTDIDRDLSEMFISDSVSVGTMAAASTDERYFTKLGQVAWIKKCVERIWESYFANEGEVVRLIDTVPQLKLQQTSWYQNLMFQPATVDETKLPSAAVDQQLTGFQMMQLMGMSELTYENYLKQFGVQSISADTGQPEILRYTRSWAQPVNTVDPATGLPSSAWVWSEEAVIDKPKRFDEPGFIIHLAAVRPKMYNGRQKYSFVGNLWGFSDWFPVYNLDDPAAGIRQILGGDHVFDTAFAPSQTTNEFLYDHRDLLSHGEQFVNDWTQPFSLPTSTGQIGTTGSSAEDVRGEYATAANITALFTSATAADQVLYYEGIAQPVINGHVRDTTALR